MRVLTTEIKPFSPRLGINPGHIQKTDPSRTHAKTIQLTTLR
jgi:hypothetical protein